MHKYLRRYTRWQENVQLTSWFVVLCGIMAIMYFFYRIILIVSPVIALEQSVFSPPRTVNSALCSQRETSHVSDDPVPLLSDGYQERLLQQRALSQNLVKNPGLTAVNPATDEPIGYFRSTENGKAKYTRSKEGNEWFLRVETTKNAANDITPAWHITPVKIKRDSTYVYSFWYRSDVPVRISTERTANKKTSYGNITMLPASKSWQRFAAHSSSGEAAGSFRVNLSAAKPGRVDTRAFNIHQIANARLAQGLVSVTFDDGWQSVGEKAASLLEKHDVRATHYIIGNAASKEMPEYMATKTLKKFHAAGHEIGSHTLAHCDQTMLSGSQLEEGATKSKQTLEHHGLGPIKSFAYPLGQYDHKTQSVYKKHYPLIRTSDFGYNDRYFDETNIRSVSVLNGTSEKEFEAWLAWTKTHRAWLVLVYHRVDERGKYSVASSQLDRHLQMINASGLKTLPLSEAAATIRK